MNSIGKSFDIFLKLSKTAENDEVWSHANADHGNEITGIKEEKELKSKRQLQSMVCANPEFGYTYVEFAWNLNLSDDKREASEMDFQGPIQRPKNRFLKVEHDR